jgi:hypothetical protein
MDVNLMSDEALMIALTREMASVVIECHRISSEATSPYLDSVTRDYVALMTKKVLSGVVCQELLRRNQDTEKRMAIYETLKRQLDQFINSICGVHNLRSL